MRRPARIAYARSTFYPFAGHLRLGSGLRTDEEKHPVFGFAGKRQRKLDRARQGIGIGRGPVASPFTLLVPESQYCRADILDQRSSIGR